MARRYQARAFVDLGAERLTLYGQIADPGRRFGALAVRGRIQLLVFGGTSRRWLPGAERLDSLPGVAAAQFGVGGDGQAPGGSGGMIPFLPVGHGLGEGPFSPLIVVAQGAVAGGQGLVPSGAVVVAGLAGRTGRGVGAERAKGSVKGAEGEFTIGGQSTGPLTLRLRSALVDIQRGVAPDPYRWIELID